jgi:hypothetical protein
MLRRNKVGVTVAQSEQLARRKKIDGAKVVVEALDAVPLEQT